MCRTEDFLELGVAEVEELISMDNIFVTSEETVVEAVLAWCKRSWRTLQLDLPSGEKLLQ